MGDERESDGEEPPLVRFEGQPEMRVGAEYQAVIPDICKPGEYRPLHKEGMLVWSPENEDDVPNSQKSLIQKHFSFTISSAAKMCLQLIPSFRMQLPSMATVWNRHVILNKRILWSIGHVTY
jgi:hypothetical protein